MLRSDLCDYSNEYIVVKGKTSVTGTNNANERNKKLTFKNNVLFRLCISKISNSFVENSEDLDLLDYSNNYSMTSEVCGIIKELK